MSPYLSRFRRKKKGTWISVTYLLSIYGPQGGQSPIADPAAIRPSLSFAAKASAFNVYKNDPQYAAVFAVDDDSGTRWATDDGIGDCWLEIDLGRPVEFDAAFLSEGWDRIQVCALEVKAAGGTWKIFHRGTTIGVSGATLAFPRTSGQIVRFHILKASAGPSIWDFELFEAAPLRSP